MARMLCLVTGCAGFIGFHVTQYLLDRGERVIGVDDLNAYYDVALKQARLAQLQGRARFEFHQIDVADPTAMTGLADRHSDIDSIIHLAAQAGVRYSLTQPLAYVEANVKGQVVLLETARKLAKLTSLVYASSSSVYGASTKQPFSVEEPADHPVSLYAATKRAGELITESYCRLYKLPCTGLRFFTVYGPWGRPDMAAFLSTDAISASSRARRSRSACRALSRGTGNITASRRRTPRQRRDGGTRLKRRGVSGGRRHASPLPVSPCRTVAAAFRNRRFGNRGGPARCLPDPAGSYWTGPRRFLPGKNRRATSSGLRRFPTAVRR